MRFEKKVWLASPTMHGDELKYMQEAYSTNWMSTVGKNIDEVERLVTEKVGCKYAVALGAGTAALHLCTRLAGEALYGRAPAGKGSLSGRKVFCSDMTWLSKVFRPQSKRMPASNTKPTPTRRPIFSISLMARPSLPSLFSESAPHT